jgi:hypothetical protein
MPFDGSIKRTAQSSQTSATPLKRTGCTFFVISRSGYQNVKRPKRSAGLSISDTSLAARALWLHLVTVHDGIECGHWQEQAELRHKSMHG